MAAVPFRDVGALLLAYPRPHILRCSSMTSGTATDASKCTCCSMGLSTATDTSRCTSSAGTYPGATFLSEVYLLQHRHNHGHRHVKMYLLWHGLVHGHRRIRVSCSMWTHPQVTHCPFDFKLTLELQPVQYCSNALAICQPRRTAIAVIRMFPGTAGADDKHYRRAKAKSRR